MTVVQTLPPSLTPFVGGTNGNQGSAGSLGDIPSIAQAIAQGTGKEVEDAITASTTQTQAGGRRLTATFNRVSVANGNDAVTFPQALPGTLLVLVNSTGNTITLFPAVGDAINAAGANNSVSAATVTTSIYVCLARGQWWGGAITNEG